VNQREIATMFVKITAKRQVTFPARVLDAMGVKPGDRIELEEGPDGFVLRARQIDRARLAPLRGKLRRGIGTFDLEVFRNKPHDRTLRD
jgi:AbrB family looped-hinge helix DNA binding protein